MNKKTLLGIIIFVLIVVVLAIVLLLKPDMATVKDFITGGTSAEEQKQPQAPAQRTGIKVYYIDSKNPQSETSCTVTRQVWRTVSVRPRMADLALKALFAGPTATEKASGLTNSFEPSSAVPAGTLPLKSYYIGVNIVDGVATVNFKPEALRYLNSAACMQASVKAPIEQTLKQFPSVQEVQYSIDGKVYTEWDA